MIKCSKIKEEKQRAEIQQQKKCFPGANKNCGHTAMTKNNLYNEIDHFYKRRVQSRNTRTQRRYVETTKK